MVQDERIWNAMRPSCSWIMNVPWAIVYLTCMGNDHWSGCSSEISFPETPRSMSLVTTFVLVENIFVIWVKVSSATGCFDFLIICLPGIIWNFSASNDWCLPNKYFLVKSQTHPSAEVSCIHACMLSCSQVDDFLEQTLLIQLYNEANFLCYGI